MMNVNTRVAYLCAWWQQKGRHIPCSVGDVRDSVKVQKQKQSQLLEGLELWVYKNTKMQQWTSDLAQTDLTMYLMDFRLGAKQPSYAFHAQWPQPLNSLFAVILLDGPIRANSFADSREFPDPRESFSGFLNWTPFLRIALRGTKKTANRKFDAIRANRSNVLKIIFCLRIDLCKSIRANSHDSRCESPGHLRLWCIHFSGEVTETVNMRCVKWSQAHCF